MKKPLRLIVVTVLATLLPALAMVPSAGAAVPSLTRTGLFTRTYDLFAPNGSIDQSFSSPGVGDVTGDGQLDVVVGGMDGVLVVLDTAGALERYVVVSAGSAIQASPSLVDLDHDGVLDVIVATVGRPAYVQGYSFTGGTQRLLFSASVNRANTQLNGFLGTPAVGDINGDGALDVVIAGLDHNLHAFNSLTGAELPGFPQDHFDTSLSSPALADIDGDGLQEIIVGGDMIPNGTLPGAGGWLWATNGDGSNVPGWPIHLSNEVLWSSPAIGDINGDGVWDVVIGTGRNFMNADSNKLYALNTQTRTMLPGWPVTLPGNTMASPALVNLDGDAGLEVVMTTGSGYLYALDPNGAVKWGPACYMNFSPCGHDYAVISSPVVANIDGDAVPEVIVSGERQIKVFDGSNGLLEAELPLLSASATSFAHPGAASPGIGRDGSGRAVLAVHVLHEAVDNTRRGRGDQQAVYVYRSTASVAADLRWSHFLRTNGRDASLDDRPPIDIRPYVDAVYRALLGRPADPSGLAYWTGRLQSGLTRPGFTGSIARTSEWTQHVVTDLYGKAFGRAPDASGLQFWSSLLQSGYPVSSLAANLYGSAEYYGNAGGTNGAYVDALYQDLVHRSPDAAGRSYWVGLLGSGTPRQAVAASLFLSYESNGDRVDALYRSLLGRAPDPAGRDYWAKQLATLDDITLAALLTASDEFFWRAVG
jgi:hypothetical protein